MERIVLIIALVAYAVSATTILSENFDEMNYSSPLNPLDVDLGDATIYPISYSSISHNSEGYSLKGDHSRSDLTCQLDGLGDLMDEGVYIRYWVLYNESYRFPGEDGGFDNVKMLKLSGNGEDIEFIYKDSSNFSASYSPRNLQLYWINSDHGGTGTGSTDLFTDGNDYYGNDYLTKGEWHKIELYFYMPDAGQHELEVQVDDNKVYSCDDCDFGGISTDYTSTQFISLRASNSPAFPYGFWNIDDISVIHDEGNLCDSEPAEPSDTNCTEGEITQGCLCNRTYRTEGYCCTGRWDNNSCRVISSHFDEEDNVVGENWTHYQEHFDLGFTDRWTIDDDCYSGTCLKSKDPNYNHPTFPFNDYDGDSKIGFSHTLNWSQELFIRYKARFPVEWEAEATDYNNGGSGADGGANHLRYDGEGGRGIEVTFIGGWLHPGGGTWFHWYDSGVNYGDPLYLLDDQWHEYALYFKMPSSDIASDGIFGMWRDGDYTNNTALMYLTDRQQSGALLRVSTATPCYYKGPVTPMDVDGHVSSGNWTYWLDEFEAWDSIPEPTVSYHDADNDRDGDIDTKEIKQYVRLWTGNSVLMTDLMEAIRLWKG